MQSGTAQLYPDSGRRLFSHHLCRPKEATGSMTQPLALVVDDEPDIRELLELTLSRMEIKSHSAEDVEQAKSLLKKHHFDLCLTDLKLPDGNGIELVEYIQQRYQDTPVAVITAHGNMESAITALKAGAFDFVSKPVDLQTLRN